MTLDYRSFVGRVLNRTYRLERLIKRGGMGAVFLAQHNRLPRSFAVKIISLDVEEEPEMLERFRREAEITCSLRHPNIVEVLDYNNSEEGIPYLVMELLEGEDLGRRIRRVRGPFDLQAAVPIFVQAAAGLGQAHQAGVVHRDVKPSNLFLAQVGNKETVKVVDFGVSKIVGSSSSLTLTRMSLGTPRFMAPEQVRKAALVDQRADIFALGAIFYTLLTGKTPFEGDAIAQVIYAVVHEDPDPLLMLRPDLPTPVVNTVEAMLHKDADHRPESMAAALEMLEDPYAAQQAAELRGGQVVVPLAPGAPTLTEEGSDAPTIELEASSTIPSAEIELIAMPADESAPVVEHPISTLSGSAGQISTPQSQSNISLSTAPPRSPWPWIAISTVAVAGAATAITLFLTTTAPHSSVAQSSQDAGRAAASAASAPASAPDAEVAAGRVSADRGSGPVVVPFEPDASPKPAPKARVIRPRRRGKGTIRVVTTAGGDIIWAEVHINGRLRGRSPLSTKLTSGGHSIEVRRDGYRSVRRRVMVRRGRVKPVRVRLVKR